MPGITSRLKLYSVMSIMKYIISNKANGTLEARQNGMHGRLKSIITTKAQT